MFTSIESFGEDASTSTGAVVTASATPNALGNWTQLGADTTRDAYLFGAVFQSIVQGVGHLVDIGIDPTGGTSYTPVVQQIPVAMANSATADDWQLNFVPFGAVFVPAGSAVAARTRASTASSPLDARALLMSGAPAEGYTWVETLGATTSDSGGISIEPGGTANAKGNWSTLSAATAYDIDAFVVMANTDAAVTANDNAEGYIDIAIEVSATQYVIVSNYPFAQAGTENTFAPRVLIPVRIPVGSKVVARAQNTTATATRRLFDLSLLCFNKHPLRAN